METFENVAAPVNDERELSVKKLMEIDGIAKKTAEALYEIGIHSYVDLIHYLSHHTAQEVSEALKEHGVNRSPALINKGGWIRQAEGFSQSENAAPVLPEGETEPAEKPEGASSGHDSRKHQAVFTVSFDVVKDEDGKPLLHTTVYDERNAGQEKVFRGSDPSPWANWLLDQANLPLAVERIATKVEVRGGPSPTQTGATEASAPPVPAGLYNARLEIGDVRLSVIGPTSQFPEKRLKAEVNFHLSGADAETLTSQRIAFRIEGYIVDLESGVLELVASDRSQLEPRVFGYRDQLEFAIPDVGRYEFYNIVLLLPPGELVAYHRGPTMKVDP
jgi:hypothetical protein